MSIFSFLPFFLPSPLRLSSPLFFFFFFLLTSVGEGSRRAYAIRNSFSPLPPFFLFFFSSPLRLPFFFSPPPFPLPFRKLKMEEEKAGDRGLFSFPPLSPFLPGSFFIFSSSPPPSFLSKERTEQAARGPSFLFPPFLLLLPLFLFCSPSRSPPLFLLFGPGLRADEAGRYMRKDVFYRTA